ncbi:YhgE/Pip family protein, partial [Collinsella aerofaciens]
AKSGISDSEEALKAASDAINAAIDGSAGSFDNVSAELEKAFDAANQHVDLTVSQLNEAAAALNTRADDIDAMADKLRNLADQVSNDKLKDGLKSAATSLGRIAVEYRNNAKDLTATAKSLSDSMAEINNSRAEVDQAIADAKAGISGAKSDYDSTFSVKAKELKKTISGVLDSLNGISGDLDSAVSGLADASGSLAKGLSKAARLVNKASDQLGEASDKISAFKDELDGALMSGDLAMIKTMIGSDPEGLAASLSGPVALDRKPVYPIRNYGSAMAPFYTILSLWVGSIVLAAMMKVSVNDELINELVPVRLHEIYLGRYLFFGGLALLQATLVCAGDILFFGIQCDNPLQFVLAGWVASLVFSNIVYTLTVSFGDIGKALAVVLLVMQVGGSGGTFPIEMTGPVFQAIYPFLPFTHGINAMHAAMAGAYHMEYWIELGVLASYLIPSLALGVVFRRPVIKANDWIIERLESTKLI